MLVLQNSPFRALAEDIHIHTFNTSTLEIKHSYSRIHQARVHITATITKTAYETHAHP